MKYLLAIALMFTSFICNAKEVVWLRPIAFSELSWMTKFVKYELQHRLTQEQKWNTDFVDIQSYTDEFDTTRICGIIKGKQGDIWFYVLAYKPDNIKTLVAVDDTAQSICTAYGYSIIRN